jgi:glucose-6-phosphate 1-dehydrogenase
MSAANNNTTIAAETRTRAEACGLEPPHDPCVLVLFGATGDLAGRKVVPSLCDLLGHGGLPEPFVVMGVGRSEHSAESFREHLREAVAEHKPDALKHWDELAPRVLYRRVDNDNDGDFKALADALDTLDREQRLGGNRIFYLAVPPTAYAELAASLGRAGLAAQDGGGWSRLVVEKPFGHDLASARELDAALHEHFEEHQIFRIDHYLAKETVQNVLSLRFANALFEPVWNRRYIRSVTVTAAESIGVGHRAGYYDRFGVLRDMFQNHMMQLLALCAMEPPSLYEADRIRDEKNKVYRALRPFPTERIEEHLVLGQYAPGTLDGELVPGYLDEDGVDPESLTPTFAAMRVFVDNWRWQGVPFCLVSGKRLAAKRTEIVIHFHEVPHSMFRSVFGEHIASNRLVLGIQPGEAVTLTFQAKAPGSRMCLRPVTMEFDYSAGFDAPALEAYEKVLLDVMLGDQTLFWRQDGVELCWGFLTPILMGCDCPEQAERLLLYKAGTWGPREAQRLMEPDS